MNVGDLVAEAAASSPARPAIIESRDGRSVTWGALEDRVAATAAHLLAGGTRPGDVVAVVVPNSIAFAVAYWGALRAGATVVPVNPGYTPPEIGHLLGDSGATTALVGRSLVDGVDAAAHRIGRPLRVEEVRADGLPGAERVRRAPEVPEGLALLCYTSGTTGRPKGARLTHANLLANLASISDLPVLRLTPQDVLLGVLPFFHVFGLNVVLNAAARHGAAVLAIDRFTPHGSAKAAAEHGVTVAYGAPPVYGAWNALPADQAPALPRLRAAVSGADALPVATWTRFVERYGVEILEGYGLTETSPVLASNAASPAVRPGTVGHALPGVALRVVDGTSADLPAGEVGEILAEGDNVFDGYHALPDATAEVFRDGWFHTGDLGSFDADGYLTIAGRLKHMLIVSGFNVYPREVEDALSEHPGVAEAVVVGVPDPRTGQRVRAVVVAQAGWDLEPEALLDHCRARLARYKLPREISVVDALPRLPTGKVARSTLRRADD